MFFLKHCRSAEEDRDHAKAGFGNPGSRAYIACVALHSVVCLLFFFVLMFTDTGVFCLLVFLFLMFTYCICVFCL